MTHLLFKADNVYLLVSARDEISRDISNIIAVGKSGYLVSFFASLNIEHRILRNTFPAMCFIITFERDFATRPYVRFRLGFTSKNIDQL